MRCRQARHRLNRHERSGRDPLTDQPLVEHLKGCRRCAEQAGVAGLLTRLLQSNIIDDEADIAPLAIARQKTEAGRSAAERRSFLRRFGDLIVGPPRRRSARLGYGLAVVGLVLVVLLVPFRYDHTVGYAVAFDGVDKELVEDNSVICDLLFDLGLWEADVDVLGCDTTCNVQVIELKSMAEARMVVNAFEQVENCCLSSDIIPVRKGATASLLQRARRDIL
jgi:hypothetical protein